MHRDSRMGNNVEKEVILCFCHVFHGVAAHLKGSFDKEVVDK